MPSLQHLLRYTFLGLLSFQVATAAPASAMSTRVVSRPFAATAPMISSTLPLVAGSYHNILQNVNPANPRPGASSLPAPAGNLTLRHITVGHGIQNYTCASANSTPVAIGAVATLYDITALALLDPNTATSIPNIAAYLPLTSALIPSMPLTIHSLGSFPILGAHYFLANGTPTFDLFTVREILFSKKVADIKAPSNALTGPAETGAVDWLALTSIEGSVGLTEVFRVATAGGNPPASCAGQQGVVSVPYSAAYHFYG
jgi:hypothetical protein